MKENSQRWLVRWRMPVLLYVMCAVVYVALLGDRAIKPSPNNHFVHLAESFLHGQLGVLGNQPPGYNDWACFDTELKDSCPPGKYRFPASEQNRYRWYVSFPPFPAILISPVVAIWGQSTPDRLFWALIAAFGPVALFLLLRRLREAGLSPRSPRQDFFLSLLFAFGTVFFFVSVQGSVWFAAHATAVPLIALYLRFAVDLRRPMFAGLALGCVFVTRPSTALLALFMAMELWRCRPKNWLSIGARFSAPILAIGLLAMWMNEARFENPFEFGHRYLQIGWRGRIDRWGLFNYHYVPRNLAIFVASLPWLTRAAPFIRISRHGLALWFTTPNLLWLIWPKGESPSGTRVDKLDLNRTKVLRALYLSALPVILLNLAYQNSGWEQFGYRFSLDYLVLLFAALALGGRKWGKVFWFAGLIAVVINTFGAVTFDRMRAFYDTDRTQTVIFQPD